MKFWFKSFLLLVTSAVIIYLMTKHDFLDLSALKVAFIHNQHLIYFVFGLQIVGCFFMTLRYFSLLRNFNIDVDLTNVTAATFVSNSLGLWMPGSMAFIEIIRIGLMLGAGNKNSYQEGSIASQREDISLKSRLATVSLFDRLLGLWAMLFIGIVIIGWIIITKLNIFSHIYENAGIFSIFIFSLFSIIVISLLPYFARVIFIRKVIAHCERIILKVFKTGIVNRFMKKIVSELNSILDTFATGGKRMSGFSTPIFYSFMCVFTQAYSTYFCALAISSNIPFSAILATVSILAIATLFPIGFGGFGGVQLVAAFSMSFFGVSPQVAASAQLLQTAVNLFAVSFVGVFFTKLSWNQLKSAKKMYSMKKMNEKNL